MPTTLFITQTEIAKYTPMGGNVDTDKYIYLVKDSQIMHVEPVLGTKLYNKLQTDFTDGSITGIYNTIVEDYIKPILIHMVFAEYVAIGAYRVQNGGLFKHLPEDGESMSLSEIESLEKNQH